MPIMSLDAAIIIVFLSITMVVGFISGRNINSIKKYALGDNAFSTGTLAATLAATWIGGGFFSVTITNTYSDGLNYIILGICEVIAFFVLSIFVAPRIGVFLGDLSIAESMRKIYGKDAQVITALVGIARVVGTIAIQFKVCATILYYFFAINSTYATCISCMLVIAYSTFGGIKAVTFTDVVQFITFIIFIPILSLAIWGTIDDPATVANAISTNPSLNFTNLSEMSGINLYNFIALIILFIIPGLDPAIFQRMIISKDAIQARLSLNIAAIAFLVILLLTFWIAILLMSREPNLVKEDVIGYIIDNYTYIGLKGILLAGIMAMLMSTADSYINSSSVLFAHDFCIPLNLEWAKNNELLLSRISAIVIGIFALIISLVTDSLFDIIVTMASFYMPLVTVPLFLAIFGFRTSTKSYLFGIFLGLTLTILTKFIDLNAGPVITVITICIVAISIVLFHYLFKQKGGWIKLTEKSSETNLSNDGFLSSFRDFNIIKLFKNSTPKNDISYTFLGLFFVVSVFSTMYSIPLNIRNEYTELLSFIYHSVLTVSAAFLTYAIWPSSFKNKSFGAVFWFLGLFYVLVFIGCLQVIISNFGQFQLMIFLLGIVVLSAVVRWQVAMFLIITGVILSIRYFKWHVGIDAIQGELGGLQFKIMYLLLMVTSILVVFLKPKQEEYEATEQKARDSKIEAEYAKRELQNILQGFDYLEKQLKQKEGRLEEKEKHLRDQLKHRNKEIHKLTDIKDEFLRNIEHEFNTPLTGILSLCDVVYSCYDDLNESMIKSSMKDIVNSSDRLKSYINSIIDVSKLSATKCELNKQDVNLSKLTKARPTLYKKIFPDETEKQKFIFDVEDNIVVNCDEYYITQAIDNLISNAVSYGKGNPITISLKKTKDNKVRFDITDQGIGIPSTELLSIFTKFKVSSKTWSLAGGRGVGLALCQSAIEAHGGTISVVSKENKGSTFTFVLAL